MDRHHPPAPSSKEEGEQTFKAPSSLEEGGGGVTRQLLLRRAAAMRRNLPEPERKLWMELRGRRFAGYKFRRQAVIGHRIVDFFVRPRAWWSNLMAILMMPTGTGCAMPGCCARPVTGLCGSRTRK